VSVERLGYHPSMGLATKVWKRKSERGEARIPPLDGARNQGSSKQKVSVERLGYHPSMGLATKGHQNKK